MKLFRQWLDENGIDSGSFHGMLAIAYAHGNAENREKLGKAFPKIEIIWNAFFMGEKLSKYEKRHGL